MKKLWWTMLFCGCTFYEQEVTGLCANSLYVFSADGHNSGMTSLHLQ